MGLGPTRRLIACYAPEHAVDATKIPGTGGPAAKVARVALPLKPQSRSAEIERVAGAANLENCRRW